MSTSGVGGGVNPAIEAGLTQTIDFNKSGGEAIKLNLDATKFDILPDENGKFKDVKFTIGGGTFVATADMLAATDGKISLQEGLEVGKITLGEQEKLESKFDLNKFSSIRSDSSQGSKGTSRTTGAEKPVGAGKAKRTGKPRLKNAKPTKPPSTGLLGKIAGSMKSGSAASKAQNKVNKKAVDLSNIKENLTQAKQQEVGGQRLANQALKNLTAAAKTGDEQAIQAATNELLGANKALELAGEETKGLEADLKQAKTELKEAKSERNNAVFSAASKAISNAASSMRDKVSGAASNALQAITSAVPGAASWISSAGSSAMNAFQSMTQNNKVIQLENLVARQGDEISDLKKQIGELTSPDSSATSATSSISTEGDETTADESSLPVSPPIGQQPTTETPDISIADPAHKEKIGKQD